MTRILRLAHRGDHRRAPENSVAAMRAALAIAGCDGLEFDVRGSADGVPVVLHDETLARVQGRPDAAASLTAEELAALGVPTLAEVMALTSLPTIAGARPFLDVELKGAPVPGTIAVLEAFRGSAARGTALGAAEAVMPELASAPGVAPTPGVARAAELDGVVVSSFEAPTLRWLGAERPEWSRWLNAENLEPATIRLAVDLGCKGISALTTAIVPATARSVSEAGLVLAAWTVTSRRDLARLEAFGVRAACVEGEALDG